MRFLSEFTAINCVIMLPRAASASLSLELILANSAVEEFGNARRLDRANPRHKQRERLGKRCLSASRVRPVSHLDFKCSQKLSGDATWGSGPRTGTKPNSTSVFWGLYSVADQKTSLRFLLKNTLVRLKRKERIFKI